MAHRAIVGFRRDEDGDWVAELACGHPQHVRHRPPMELRPWVLTEEGRRTKVGESLDCLYCNMPALPPGAVVYKSTAVFTETTVPKGLLREHRTRAGTWGRIEVLEGRLLYALADREAAWVLRPGIDGIIAPESPHSVAPRGPVRFIVHFLRSSPPRG